MRKQGRISAVGAWDGRKTACILLIAYAACVVVRFLFAIATTTHPTTLIDEFLYYSLARSIATGEGLLYHGQSAEYAFLVYPLILSPIYKLFGESLPLFRILQLWNISLMSLSLFPIYALANALGRDQKRALGATILALFLPDFILGETLLSEAILYPMFFTLMYAAYQYIDKERLRDMLLIGVLGGLMYSTKPGQVVPAAVTFLVCAFLAVRKKQWKSLLHILAGIGCALVIIAAFYLLVIYGFGYNTTLMSIYDAQMGVSADQHIGVFAKSSLLYLYYIILAGGVGGFVLPLVFLPRFDKKRKSFFAVLSLSLLFMIVGTSWVINRVEYTINTLHMRYIAMYVPMLLLLCAIPLREMGLSTRRIDGSEKAGKWMWKGVPWYAWAALAFTLAMTFLYGCGAGVNANMAIISNMTLAFMREEFMPKSSQWICAALIAIGCAAAFLLLRKAGMKRVQTTVLTVMAILMIVNSTAEYSLMRKRAYLPALVEDSAVAKETIGDGEYLFVVSHNALITYSPLDVNSKKNTNILYLDDLFNQTYASGGVYVPFVPEQHRGMFSGELTPDTNTIVLESTAFDMVKPASGATVTRSPNGILYTVTFEKGERWADSMLGNVKMHSLSAGTPLIVAVFGEELLSGPITLRVQIESGQSTTMDVQSEHNNYTVNIAEGEAWYELAFDTPDAAYNLFVMDCDIRVNGYEIYPTAG